MVEVLVAFTLLSIMLVVFSEGIAWASKSEVNATKSRRSADASMRKFQTELAAGRISSYPAGGVPSALSGKLKRGVYTCTGEDGRTYTYVFYTA